MKPATGPEAPPEDLAGLAAGIRSRHEAYEAAIKSGLEHAIACGYLLKQAKAKLAAAGMPEHKNAHRSGLHAACRPPA